MSNYLLNHLRDFDKEETLSSVMSILYCLRNEPEFSVTSELMYILDYDNFIKLITYYGGMTIRIPTTDEVNETMQLLLIDQYTNVDGLSWEKALEKVGVDITDKERSKELKSKLHKINQLLKNLNLNPHKYK